MFHQNIQTPRSGIKNDAYPSYLFLTQFEKFEYVMKNSFECLIERFSIECRKTKPKVITLTNHNSRKQSNEPIRAQSKYTPSAGNACGQVTIGFGFTSDWSRKWREILSQSQTVAMQNQSNCVITFDNSIEKRSIASQN